MTYEISYQQQVLSNDLRVIYASVPWSRTFAVTLTFQVGWRDEPKKYEGITHFLEHFAFLGENERLAEILSREGVYVNAVVECEQTLFTAAGHANLLSNSLDFFANVLAEAPINPVDMERELEILNHELALNRESPVDLELRKIAALIIGDRDFSRIFPRTVRHLSRLHPDEIASYRHNWFAPSNAFLTIVSPLKAEKAFGLVKDRFGRFPNRPVMRPERQTQKQKLPRLIVRRFPGSHAMVQVFYTMSPINRCMFPALSMLTDLNSGQPHGRLFQEIRQKRQMGYEVGSDFTVLSDFMIFSSFAVVHKRFVHPALEQILDSVKKLCQIDHRTFCETQERFIYSLDIVEDSPMELCAFITDANIGTDPQSLLTPAQYRLELENLSYDEFIGIVREILHPERLMVALFGEIGIFKKWGAERILKAYQTSW